MTLKILLAIGMEKDSYIFNIENIKLHSYQNSFAFSSISAEYLQKLTFYFPR